MKTYQNNTVSLSSLLIDCLKLLLAIFVIGIHVGKICDFKWPTFIDFLFGLAVPCFFAVSGYYQTNRLDRDTLLKSVKKYVNIYIKWMIVYIPFGIFYYCKHSMSATDSIRDYIHGFAILGETPMTWHLWYIHAMILVLLYCLLIKLLINKRGQCMYVFVLCIVSSTLLAIYVYFSPFSDDYTIFLGLNKFQNSLFCGLPCFCAGVWGGGIFEV